MKSLIQMVPYSGSLMGFGKMYLTSVSVDLMEAQNG